MNLLKHFVYCLTIQAIGAAQTLDFGEKNELSPLTPYFNLYTPTLKITAHPLNYN